MKAEIAEKELAESSGISMKLEGKTRLDGHSTVKGVEVLQLSMTASGQVSGLAGLPPGASFRSGTMQSSGHSTIPVDVTKPGLGSTFDMDVSFKLAPTNNPSGQRSMETTFHEHKEMTCELLKD